MKSEATLFERLRSEDRVERDRAEVELFETFESRVRAILSRIVGSGAELDDAVQEVFVDIFRGLPKFGGRSELGTWIYRVALRRGWKCAAREKAARERRVDDEALLERAAHPANYREIERRELAQRLESALKRLDFDQRSVLALRACEDLTPAEIARTLGIAVGTVHSRLSRARARLRTLLQLDSR